MSKQIKQVVKAGQERAVVTRVLSAEDVMDRALIEEMEERVRLEEMEARKPKVMDVQFRDLLWGLPKNKAVVGARLIAYLLLAVPAYFAGINLGKSTR